MTWFVALFLELLPTGAMPSNCPWNWTELSDFRAEPEAAPRCTRCTFRYHSNPETRTVLTAWSELSATASVFIQCNRQIQQFRSCCCTFFYHFSLEVNNSERKKENQDKKKREWKEPQSGHYSVYCFLYMAPKWFNCQLWMRIWEYSYSCCHSHSHVMWMKFVNLMGSARWGVARRKVKCICVYLCALHLNESPPPVHLMSSSSSSASCSVNWPNNRPAICICLLHAN